MEASVINFGRSYEENVLDKFYKGSYEKVLDLGILCRENLLEMGPRRGSEKERLDMGRVSGEVDFDLRQDYGDKGLDMAKGWSMEKLSLDITPKKMEVDQAHASSWKQQVRSTVTTLEPSDTNATCLEEIYTKVSTLEGNTISTLEGNTVSTFEGNDCLGKKDNDGPIIAWETDVGILRRRTKQLEYGKNSTSYVKYLYLLPRHNRDDKMPRTPNKNKKYSRRQWDGLVKSWKKRIHTTAASLQEREEYVGRCANNADIVFHERDNDMLHNCNNEKGVAEDSLCRLSNTDDVMVFTDESVRRCNTDDMDMTGDDTLCTSTSSWADEVEEHENDMENKNL